MFGDFGAGVCGSDDGAEASGCSDGGESGYACAGDEDFCGGYFSGCGYLAGEEAAEFVCGFDDGAVASDIGHGGQDVHGLCAGDAGDGVHG